MATLAVLVELYLRQRKSHPEELESLVEAAVRRMRSGRWSDSFCFPSFSSGFENETGRFLTSSERNSSLCFGLLVTPFLVLLVPTEITLNSTTLTHSRIPSRCRSRTRNLPPLRQPSVFPPQSKNH